MTHPEQLRGTEYPEARLPSITTAVQFLSEFDSYLGAVRGLAQGTRRKYGRFVQRFLDGWCGNSPPNWQDLSTEHLRTYLRQEFSSRKAATIEFTDRRGARNVALSRRQGIDAARSGGNASTNSALASCDASAAFVVRRCRSADQMRGRCCDVSTIAEYGNSAVARKNRDACCRSRSPQSG